MPKENEVVEEVVEEVETPEEVVETPEEKPVKKEKSYVQIQKERAAEKARKELLQTLGVESIDEAKAKLEDGAKALEIATEVKAKIEAEEKAAIDSRKSKALNNLFKDTFDPEVLTRLTNLDDIELDANGSVINGDALLEQMKSERPHFFGQTVLGADKHPTNTKPGNVADPITAAYEAGDYQASVRNHLNALLKK